MYLVIRIQDCWVLVLLTYGSKSKTLKRAAGQTSTKHPIFTPSRYRQLVGKLDYLTIKRPYISFAVIVVSQFLEAPRLPNWNVN